jgi:light-harvesting complex 1 beta chain
MSASIRSNSNGVTDARREARKGFALIFAISFLAFLVIAVTGAVLGAPWRTWLPGAEGGQSLVGGVKAAVYSFMSHL